MAYQRSAGHVRTRQHRAVTAPAPSAIPPSLIPGHRHNTFSATGANTLTSGFLSFGPSTGTNHSIKAPATAYTLGGDAQDYFSMNPSPYHDFQPPPPPPPLPMPQSLLHQSAAPPLPPKTPVIMSPSTSPTLPPKPPQFMPSSNSLPPSFLARSRSQPPPLIPHGASAPPHVSPLPPPPLIPHGTSAPPHVSPLPPPPPTPPPKPLNPRSPSLSVIRSPGPQPLAQPNVSPRPKSSSIGQEPNDVALPTSPSAKSSAEDPFGMNEEEELELALKLSAQAERERAKVLLSQDEDLARALEQSEQVFNSAPRPGPSGSRPGPSTLDNGNMPSSSSMITRDAHPRNEMPVSRNVTILPVDVQLKEDEELARRLEAEYDNERPAPTPETNQRVDPNPSEGPPPLPRYADIVGRETGARCCNV